MITVTIYQRCNNQHKEIIGYEMKGHAGYAESGFDIYCSAVSVLAITTANSLEQIAHVSIKEKESDGYLKIQITDEPNEASQLLLQSMILGLKGILNDNGKKFLKVNFEEV
ncbi:MAG: ribosomal-processing cysteine protease Prp [Agathobacter sp.]|uniref:ribosomal-processing cysteine protease Prp n=1 Tax=Agathobacter sp. TaxID=2021311 RepID=UPI0025892B57|nr:ribosomal-processing cysteine protease Prp [Agathobacter sp.]MCR5677440.1 ribosomal-processing cysteine protease Prp [Agathobacter sp.]